MLPSETARGRLWLSNFELADRPAAQILLDSVRLVGSGNFHSGLKELLARTLAGLGPSKANIIALGEPTSAALCYNSASELVRSGSDHVVAEIVERIAAQMEQGHDLSVETMRAEKTDRIVVVTDAAGSGDQIVRLIEFVLSNPAVKSWISGKLITIHVVTYALSHAAFRRLSSHRAISSVDYVEITRDLESAGWSAQIEATVRSVAKKYAARPADALGWDRTGGLTAFAHSIPNNTPAVFRQSRGPKGRPWKPLLPKGRRGGWSAAMERDLGDYSPPTSFGSVMDALGRLRLGRLSIRELGVLQSNGFGKDTLLLLQLLALRARNKSPEEIAQVLGAFSEDLTHLFKVARMNGYLDDGLRLTPRGRGLLRFAARKHRQVKDFPSPSLYYPQSLR